MREGWPIGQPSSLLFSLEIFQRPEKGIFEDLLLMLGEEADLDRHLEQSDFQLLRDPLEIQDPLAVLLSGRHQGGRVVADSLHDPLYVVPCVLVMVLEAETLHDPVLVAQVHPQRSVLRNAGEQDELL